MKGEKLSSVDKLLLKGCDAINAINVVEKTLRERVGMKTKLKIDRNGYLKITRHMEKARKEMQEVMKCISEASKDNRREDV